MKILVAVSQVAAMGTDLVSSVMQCTQGIQYLRHSQELRLVTLDEKVFSKFFWDIGHDKTDTVQRPAAPLHLSPSQCFCMSLCNSHPVPYPRSVVAVVAVVGSDSAEIAAGDFGRANSSSGHPSAEFCRKKKNTL